jgi:C4-dicarboxylate-specific signal transduction histidine kinase
MFKSIRTPLILFFIAVLIVTNSAIIIYALSQSYTMLEEESSKGLSSVVEGTNKLIQSRVTSEVIFLSEIANNPILDDQTPWAEKVTYLQERADSRGYEVFAFIEPNGVITRYDKEKSKGNAVGRDYFDKAIKGEPAISDIIISSVTGEPIIVIAVPIRRAGKIIGVLNGVRPQTGLNAIMEDFKYGESGAAFVLNKEGVIMAHTNRELVLNQVNFIDMLSLNMPFSELEFKAFLNNEAPVIDKFVNQTGQEILLAMTPIPETNWILVASAETREIYKSIYVLERVLIYALVIILFMGIVATYLIANQIIKPLKKITLQVDEISSGNLNQAIESTLISKNNEIGVLSHSFERMRQELSESFNEIQLANAQLEQKVEVRTKELSQYVKELERTQIELIEVQKQLTLASLIKWIAHHMNTPLGTVVSSLSFLKFNLEKKEPIQNDDVEETLSLIELSAKRLVNIIESLKRISMNDGGSGAQTIELSTFIKEYMNFLIEDTANNTFEFSMDDSIVFDTNPTVLFQVISILIENALTHAYSDGQQKYVKIVTAQEDAYIYIKIIDFGKGLSIEYTEQLFKPFYEKLTSRVDAGLGLQIAYHQTTTQLGGVIYIDPTEVGACFVVKLPL